MAEGTTDQNSRLRDKVCRVCGDRALGYNFNAITCESCKAFFRRNALKDKDFKCPFNEQCEITAVTRRFCQLCRLIKCFHVGMKKEYIMSEDDKKVKRKKIEENRKVRKRGRSAEESDSRDVKRTDKGESKVKGEPEEQDLLDLSTEAVASFPSPSVPEPLSPSSSTVTESRTCTVFPSTSQTSRSRSAEIYAMSSMSRPASAQPRTPTPTSEGTNTLLKDILEGSSSRYSQEEDAQLDADADARDASLLTSLISNSAPVEPPAAKTSNFRTAVADEVLQDIPSRGLDVSNSMESILSEAIKLEYEAYSSMNPRINSRELNDAERAKLNELIVANKALLAPLDDDLDMAGLLGDDLRLKASCHRPMLVDVLNLTAVAIRRLIKMSKKVNAFKNMCQEDQVALLKGGCTEMMILRSAMSYDSDWDSWKIPHSKDNPMNIKVDVLKEAGGKVFEEHQRFLQTFDPRWRNDENIMLILSAITLFTPDRPRVVHYDVIKLEQNSYYYLLRRYLESCYPGCEARSTFLKLIHKMAELHRLNEDHVRVYLDVNPKEIEPLLIEIFDLKPH